MTIAVIKILAIFITLILALRFKIKLTYAIIGLVFMVALIYAIPPAVGAQAAANILVHPRTIKLIIIVVTVLYISAILQKRKMFDKLIASLNVILRDSRLTAIISPAIVGFLPMPGGALVSAPLVSASTQKMNLEPEFNTFLNYWFRHIWEFVWPAYAAIVMFQDFSQIPLKTIILYQSPYTLLNLVSGLVITYFYFRKNNIGPVRPEGRFVFRAAVTELLEGVWPILLVIVLFFATPLPLHFVMIITAVTVTILKRVSFREIIGNLFSKSIINIVILISVVMVFQSQIEISNAFGVLSMMNVSRLAVVLIVFFVSFSMGFLTGVNTSYIVIAYPILKPLILTLPAEHFVMMSCYVYIIGLAGILSSPVHLCLVLTNEYFKSSLGKVFRYLAPSIVLLILASTAAALLL